jgi:hypothetical protein
MYKKKRSCEQGTIFLYNVIISCDVSIQAVMWSLKYCTHFDNDRHVIFLVFNWNIEYLENLALSTYTFTPII